jgi:hypothetical protein
LVLGDFEPLGLPPLFLAGKSLFLLNIFYCLSGGHCAAMVVRAIGLVRWNFGTGESVNSGRSRSDFVMGYPRVSG